MASLVAVAEQLAIDLGQHSRLVCALWNPFFTACVPVAVALVCAMACHAVSEYPDL